MVPSEYVTTTVDNTPNDTLGFDRVSAELLHIMSKLIMYYF